MTAIYVESSALLSWLFGEAHSDEVRAQLDAADHIVTSVLTVLEAQRALVRFQIQAKAKEADVRRSLAQVERLIASWTTMEISPSVRRRAGQAFPVEPLRTLDAIHLATALDFVAAYSELQVLSFDRRILDNLMPLGLARAAAS